MRRSCHLPSSTEYYTDSTTDVTEDINGFTESVEKFICDTTEATVPRTTVKSLHNQKPWITRVIQGSIILQTTANHLGLLSGNMNIYNAAVCDVWRAIKKSQEGLKEKWNYNSRRACGNKQKQLKQRFLREFKHVSTTLHNDTEPIPSSVCHTHTLQKVCISVPKRASPAWMTIMQCYSPLKWLNPLRSWSMISSSPHYPTHWTLCSYARSLLILCDKRIEFFKK